MTAPITNYATCAYCRGGPGWHYAGCSASTFVGYYPQPFITYAPCHNCAKLADEMAALRAELTKAITRLAAAIDGGTDDGFKGGNDL